MRHKKWALLGCLAVVASPLMPTAGATPALAHGTFGLPYTISTSILPESYCDNTGPHITFSSILTLGDHAAQLEMIQNINKQDTVVGSLALSLYNLDGTVGNPTVTKMPVSVGQPNANGVGGNPFLYYRDLTTYGTPDYTGDVYLGRCVQDFRIGNDNGRGPFTNHGSLDGFSDVAVQSLSCSNKGSSINFTTNSGSDDPTGMLVLTNNYVDLNGATPHVSDDAIAASVTFDLAQTSWRKGGGRFDGIGGNPKIGIDFGTLDHGIFTADPGSHQDLGRCNKLG